MGWGDEIVAAGQAQRMFDANGLRVEITGLDGKRRWHPIWDGNPIIVKPGEAFEFGQILRSGPNCRPYIVPPFTTETGWTFNPEFKCRDHVAKLYLTPQERQRGIDARARYGPYVLIEPYTKHDNFRWPLQRWKQLVAACPDITFVQHTHPDSPALPGYVRQEVATFREACGLIASAELYIRSESGLCHAAAAIGTRQVTLFGGCMDASVMGYYPKQFVIEDGFSGSPCGSWKPCQHCTEAMERITVGQVVTALRAQMRTEVAA